jgi:hypothetical protein
MSQLDDLLKQHRSEIEKLKGFLCDVLAPEYDDIWMLRYILSFKTADAAQEPCKFTINW